MDSDIYVRDMAKNKLYLVSVSSSGVKGNLDSYGCPSISSDGRDVAFQSAACNLVQGDTNGASDIFVHDMKTGKTERISVSSSGKQQTLGNIYDYGYGGISLSFDGRYVSFVSQGTNFAKGISTNTCHYTIGLGVDEPCANIYLHDRQTGQTSIISISGSNKSGNADSSSPTMSQDGQWIAFASSASNLVAGDTNGQSDIFLYHR